MANSTTESRLVPIRVFSTEAEALIARSALDAFGIENVMTSDDCGGQRPHWTYANGVRLMVREEDAGLANDALRNDVPTDSD